MFLKVNNWWKGERIWLVGVGDQLRAAQQRLTLPSWLGQERG